MVNWQKFEHDVQAKLELDSTIASGNKWYDMGDAVSNKNHQDEAFPIVLDCKATEKKSFRIDRAYLEQWRKKALLQGKRFLLPIRYVNDDVEYDWCVLHLDELAELLSLAQEEKIEVVQDRAPDEILNAIDDLYDQIKSISDPAIRLSALEAHEKIQSHVGGNK